MSAVPNANDEPRRVAWTRGESVRTYTRAAGVLLLLSIIAGAFGELYVPSKLIVSADAAATARNITTSASLYRLGFAVYLVEALCDVTLSLVFYVLLRPVHRNLALLAAFFGLVSTALYAVGEIFYFAPLLLLSGADYLKPFSPEQVNALALLSLKLFARVSGIFMVLYGVATALRGYLIIRSGYLPATLGVLLALAGAGFIVKCFTLVLAPAYSSDVLLLPMFVAAVSLMAWLLVKGVDVATWEARVAARGSGMSL